MSLCQHCNNHQWQVETGSYLGPVRLCAACFEVFGPARKYLRLAYYTMLGSIFGKGKKV